MKELVVVAYHGTQWVGQCVASITGTPVLAVDTGPLGPAPNQHPTGAYLWAYRNYPADRYLFIQDSMTAIEPDPCGWFRDQLGDAGAVAWGKFGLAFDTVEQESWVRQQYEGWAWPGTGIVGPIMYVPRESLDLLSEKQLLPWPPTNRIQAQGTERAWGFAFHAAGLQVAGPMWDKGRMEAAWGSFRKVWAARP
jgi:hypothetical protein